MGDLPISTNRYSMPVTRSRTSYDIGLEDSNNTAGFLFDDEEDNSGEGRATPTGQVSNADAFPTLFRQQGYSNRVSLAFSVPLVARRKLVFRSILSLSSGSNSFHLAGN